MALEVCMVALVASTVISLVLGAWALVEHGRRLDLEAEMLAVRVSLDDPLLPEHQRASWRGGLDE